MRSIAARALLARELTADALLGCRLLRAYPIDRWVVDFYCPGLRLAIIVERIVRDDLRALRRIERRMQRLQRLDIVALQFTEEEIVHNPDGVMSVIRRWVRNRPQRWGARSGSAPVQDAVAVPLAVVRPPQRARRSSAC